MLLLVVLLQRRCFYCKFRVYIYNCSLTSCITVRVAFLFVQPLDVEPSPIKLMLRKEFHEQRYFVLLSIERKNFSIQIPSKISTEQIKRYINSMYHEETTYSEIATEKCIIFNNILRIPIYLKFSMEELNLKNFNIQSLQKFPMTKLKDTVKLIYDEETIYFISKFNLLEKHTIQQAVTIDIIRTPRWKNKFLRTLPFKFPCRYSTTALKHASTPYTQRNCNIYI